MLFKCTLVLLVCILLIDPSDAWGRRLKKKLKKIIKKVKEPVKKIGCKALFAVACPANTIAKVACTVGERKICKRSVDMSVNIEPFSDDMSDYDVNGDKRVNYEEFVSAVTNTVNLAEPAELRRPFTFADVNGDGELDTQEFIAAPFLFAHVEHSNNTNTISTA
ncbi:uncharacterized protein LOC128220565 [Mya arenaria]|uniref:uncharacterized protein LOC128220565 n=1 Tax=Mya arenaria TaxID=6604 RepID=UPI0022E96B8F|nr:uncharacterized protein LOC128220565 [Mya arenaria]XP_052784967.1 uncharacterized protein LOC128220565 [Mya arenaria]XP_052784968.1 uncharacterized protein LOC128220565 [Mya arenaria]